MDPLSWQVPPYKVRFSVSADQLGQVIPWGTQILGIPELHKLTKGEGELVAVIDTGIDASHTDLKDQIDPRSRDFTGSRYGLEDRVGHGTHVAGTIAAADNGQGILGIAPKARILACKALGDDGSGTGDQIATAIRHAMSCKAWVMNMSLGSPDADPLILAAMKEYVNAGGIAIVASGNSGPGENTGDYPSLWGNVAVSVAAIDENKRVARFSSRSKEVDVAAPGVNVASCWPQNRYAYLDGTSMATPHVSGVVALARAYRAANKIKQFANQREVNEALWATAIDIPEDPMTADGRGIVNPKGMIGLKAAPEPGPVAPGEPTRPPDLKVNIGRILGYDCRIYGWKAPANV